MQDQRPPAVERRSFAPRLLAAPVVAVAALGLIYLVTRPLGGEPQPSFFVIGSAAPGVRIGQIAPGTAQAPASSQLALNDVQGAPLDLREFGGRPLWVIFWKTACEPCEAEAADVAAAYDAHRPEGLAIVGVDVWDSPAVVGDYTEAHPVDYPIGVDPTGGFLSAYGVWGAPTHYFIGSDGIIRDRFFGPMSRDQIEASLRRILPVATSS